MACAEFNIYPIHFVCQSNLPTYQVLLGIDKNVVLEPGHVRVGGVELPQPDRIPAETGAQLGTGRKPLTNSSNISADGGKLGNQKESLLRRTGAVEFQQGDAKLVTTNKGFAIGKVGAGDTDAVDLVLAG